MNDTQHQAVYGTEFYRQLPEFNKAVKYLLTYFAVLFVGGLFLALVV